jgi:kynurenine formamidase
MRVIDLSDKFLPEQYTSNPHSGTHIDFPAYLFADGRRIEEFGLERFMTDAALLDLTHKKPGNRSMMRIWRRPKRRRVWR